MRKLRNKKAVIPIIGYVLLVVFALVISVAVYSWLKSYIPKDTVECADGSSLFLKRVNFNITNSFLSITTRNDGRFDVSGYLIHASNNSSLNPTLDLSLYLNEDSQGIRFGNSVLYSITGTNELQPGDERTNTFDIPPALGDITDIRIIPTRFQEEDNRKRFVICGESRVEEIVSNNTVCIPSCSGKQCGSNGCGGQCSPGCGIGLSCNALGQCVSGIACGNGVVETGEQCDDQNTIGGDGCDISCQLEPGWTCNGSPSSCIYNGNVLFSDDFDGYNNVYGLPLYAEMLIKGWEVIDRTAPIPDDDAYLNDSKAYNGTYSIIIQDDSEIIGNISTVGYENISFEYNRRTFSLPSSDRFRIYWRVGSTGSWTSLEAINDPFWTLVQWNLTGAEDQQLIQIRFFLDNGNNDAGLLDDVIVKGDLI